ncbi:hypothetical protein PIB30_022469, partial [Stylosanthes scabra]|nr:hypothetical protein [Stylosanthes scabra]
HKHPSKKIYQTQPKWGDKDDRDYVKWLEPGQDIYNNWPGIQKFRDLKPCTVRIREDKDKPKGTKSNLHWVDDSATSLGVVGGVVSFLIPGSHPSPLFVSTSFFSGSLPEIREAYRKLQKKHHPDIVGQKGHEYTLLLNEAYEVLMRNDLRRKYDESRKQMGIAFGENNPPLGSSMWKGPIRSQALFVDENACIGCRECVHHASNTFIMDEARGCARVKVQDGDMDKNIEVAIESCPVNCIYSVNTEELAVLEFLIQPQPKDGYGVFGGGWERPKNIFTAAESFKKQLKRQATTSKHPNTS